MLVIDLVAYVRHGGYYIHIEFAVQTFLNDFHVQQTKEAATEAKAQSYGTFWREGQRSIVQLEFLERSTKVLEVFGFNRVETCKYHGFYFFKTGNGFLGWVERGGDGVAHLYFCSGLDARYDVAYITAMQFLAW